VASLPMEAPFTKNSTWSIPASSVAVASIVKSAGAVNIELFAGDAVTIHSSLLEVNEKSMRILHKMTDDETGEVAAVTVIVAVHLDAATRKARALPSDVRDLAAVVVCGTCGVDGRDNPDHQLEMTGAGADRSVRKLERDPEPKS